MQEKNSEQIEGSYNKMVRCESLRVEPPVEKTLGFSQQFSNYDPFTEVVGVLEEAKQIVTGARREEYGGIEDSFKIIADLWTVYLKKPVSSKDVAMLMVLMKVAREEYCHKTDNLVDICGYASLAEVLK